MERLAACRICLSVNEQRVVEEAQLQEIYERLTTVPFQTDDMRPLTLCYICHARLSAARRLTLKCLRAEEMLTEILLQMSSEDEDRKRMLIKQSAVKQLSISSVVQLNIDSVPENVNIDIKEELIDHEEDVNINIKEELIDHEENVNINIKEELIDHEEDIKLDHQTMQATPIAKKPKHKRETKTKHMKICAKVSTRATKSTKKPVVDKSLQGNVENNIRCTPKNNSHVTNDSRDSSKSDAFIDKMLYLEKRKIKCRNQFICDVCSKCLNTKTQLIKHFRTHTGDKSYVCDVCEKRFSTKQNLLNHSLVHTGEKPYVCNICKQSFNRKGHLLTHSYIHTGETPYVCKTCNKRFNQNSNLLRHLRIHSGEKPYVCNICNQSFNRKSHLLTHSYIHTGETPYVCNICNKRFNQKYHLLCHSRKHR